ncbi:hypothetical protein K438DRAFT_1910147 [Mycena galopus ATCC 62051]|nr:hypothetical protein K438DRAFT_1910147 [Mycena galopus ATCC 62051]
MISVMMQSTNQKSNALESVFGIFLHAMNTPSKVIETLAHIGISISVDAMDDAIHSLSRETYHTLHTMGQTLLVGYAYDNFDINFPGLVPTIKKSTDTLTHLTSGGLMFLEHGVEVSHLHVSEELWSRNPLNPTFNAACTVRRPPIQFNARRTIQCLVFRSDLIKYGPDYFTGFAAVLGKPEMVEQIPVVQMRWGPAKSLDAIPEFLGQGGVRDPAQRTEGVWERNVLSILAYVILFHSDLGTGEHIMSILQRRSIKDTP